MPRGSKGQDLLQGKSYSIQDCKLHADSLRFSAVNLVTSPVTAPTQLPRELPVVGLADKVVVVVATRNATRSVLI